MAYCLTGCAGVCCRWSWRRATTRSAARTAKWSDGQALLIILMAREKLCVKIVSIDTPSSSRRSCFCPERQIARAHHEPSASHSHGQPGQLRRRGWAERVAAQRPQAAPCARRARGQQGKAGSGVDGQGKMQREQARIRIGGAQERHSRLVP